MVKRQARRRAEENEMEIVRTPGGDVVVAHGRLLGESLLQVIKAGELETYALTGALKVVPTLDVVVVGELSGREICVFDMLPVLAPPQYLRTPSGAKSSSVAPGSALGTRTAVVPCPGGGEVHLAFMDPADVQESPRRTASVLSAPACVARGGRMERALQLVVAVPLYERDRPGVFVLDGPPSISKAEGKARASGHQVGRPYAD